MITTGHREWLFRVEEHHVISMVNKWLFLHKFSAENHFLIFHVGDSSAQGMCVHDQRGLSNNFNGAYQRIHNWFASRCSESLCTCVPFCYPHLALKLTAHASKNRLGNIAVVGVRLLPRRSPSQRFCDVSVNMSVCSLVIDRITVSQDGKKVQRPARVIVACEDHITGEVVCSSKYIHYPRGDIVHSEFAYNYNGIDATTLSTHGEKFSAVVDWVRAAIRCRIVVVCGMVDVEHFVDEAAGCRLVDLQDFFITRNDAGIDEPVSLARLAKRFYSYDSKRDAYADARMKLGLYYIMRAFKLSRIVTPPFGEHWFPKNVSQYKTGSLLRRLHNVSLDDPPSKHSQLCTSCVKQPTTSPADPIRFQTTDCLDKHTYENDTDTEEPLIAAPPPSKDLTNWP